MTVKCSNKGSIILPGGGLLRPGMTLGQGVMSDAQVREHLNSGYLMELPSDAPPPPVAPEPTPVVREDNVGESRDKSLTTGADIEDAQKSAHAQTQVAGVTMPGSKGGVSQGKVEKTDEPVGEKLVSEGKWNFDPKAVSDKDLDTLNLMVLEIDDSIEPFETLEEVRAHLSQDFREKE